MGISKRMDDARWLIEQVRDRIDNQFLAALADVEIVALCRSELARYRAEIRYRDTHRMAPSPSLVGLIAMRGAVQAAATKRVNAALAAGVLRPQDVWWRRAPKHEPVLA